MNEAYHSSDAGKADILVYGVTSYCFWFGVLMSLIVVARIMSNLLSYNTKLKFKVLKIIENLINLHAIVNCYNLY